MALVGGDTAAVVLLILMISISEACGQAALKKCRIDNRWHFFLIAVACYSMVCFLLLQTYSYKEMAIVNILWSGISVFLIVTTGVVFFHERLNVWDLLGILFIFIGMFFVFVKGHTS